MVAVCKPFKSPKQERKTCRRHEVIRQCMTFDVVQTTLTEGFGNLPLLSSHCVFSVPSFGPP